MAQVVELPRRSRKAPIAKNGKVPPRRRPNRALRSREYLTPDEVERLLAAAGQRGRHDARDRTLLLMMFRHGLRVSEAVSLRWDQVDLKAGLLQCAALEARRAFHTPAEGSRASGATRSIRFEGPCRPPQTGSNRPSAVIGPGSCHFH
jgi:integrase